MKSLTANEGPPLLMLFSIRGAALAEGWRNPVQLGFLSSQNTALTKESGSPGETTASIYFGPGMTSRSTSQRSYKVGKQDGDLPKGNSWACLVQIQTTCGQTCWIRRKHKTQNVAYFLPFFVWAYFVVDSLERRALPLHWGQPSLKAGSGVMRNIYFSESEIWPGGGQPSELSARSVRKPSWITDSLVSASPALVGRFTKSSFIFRLDFRRSLSDSSSNVMRSSSTFNIQYSNTSRFKQVFKSGFFSKLNQENFSNFIQLFARRRRVNGKPNGRGVPWIPSPEQTAANWFRHWDVQRGKQRLVADPDIVFKLARNGTPRCYSSCAAQLWMSEKLKALQSYISKESGENRLRSECQQVRLLFPGHWEKSPGFFPLIMSALLINERKKKEKTALPLLIDLT